MIYSCTAIHAVAHGFTLLSQISRSPKTNFPWKIQKQDTIFCSWLLHLSLLFCSTPCNQISWPIFQNLTKTGIPFWTSLPLYILLLFIQLFDIRYASKFSIWIWLRLRYTFHSIDISPFDSFFTLDILWLCWLEQYLST